MCILTLELALTITLLPARPITTWYYSSVVKSSGTVLEIIIGSLAQSFRAEDGSQAESKLHGPFFIPQSDYNTWLVS